MEVQRKKLQQLSKTVQITWKQVSKRMKNIYNRNTNNGKEII